MKYASIGPIAVHLPQKVETNAELRAAFPAWDMDEIGLKTGIQQRHIAAENECSSDLAAQAAEKLFAEYDIDRSTIDYLLFCTQTPDYSLPTTACLLQNRLGLGTHIGAIDFNLGCSGFVYGLSLADGLIRGGIAKRVLLLTGETYTKLIHPTDRSLRPIFGDAGAATLIESSDVETLKGFQFGTDGSGADTLFATKGGFRPADQALRPRHRKRWPSELYMDGPSLISFTVGKIPDHLRDICKASGVGLTDIDLLLFHQATHKLLDMLRETLGVDPRRLPVRLRDIGNTVSCTIPILIDQMRKEGAITPQRWNLLVGFGVGWSWAGCVWREMHDLSRR